jgi:hypothetical protein
MELPDDLPEEIAEIARNFLQEINIDRIEIDILQIERQHISAIAAAMLRGVAEAWRSGTFDDTSRWDAAAQKYSPLADRLHAKFMERVQTVNRKWEAAKSRMAEHGYIWPGDAAPPGGDWPEFIE